MNNFECVKLLIQANANLDIKDNDGNTPLHLASRYGLDKNVEMLIKAGANLDILNNKNQTAEDVALENNSLDIFNLIKSYKQNKILSELNDIKDNKSIYRERFSNI